MKRLNLINSHSVFISTIIVIPTILLIIYLTGIKDHRSLYQNSIIATTVLSLVFLIFITTGLFRGWKLKDTLGNFRTRISNIPPPTTTAIDAGGLPGLDVGAGIEGCLISFILWIVIALFGSFLLWLLGAFFWATILVLAGLLYWVVFRAFRLIFRNSSRSKGNLLLSLQIGVLYTLLYSCWIYAIIFTGHYFL